VKESWFGTYLDIDIIEDDMSQLLERLILQLKEHNGISYDKARSMAKNILKKRGHLDHEDKETFKGTLRSVMTPEQRAIDRAIKKRGGNYEDYEYDYEKNYAYKKKRKK
tara:strand:+ start:113 stop:439 length:327 start_codon:yes stop_codon:yes gene_type:complete